MKTTFNVTVEIDNAADPETRERVARGLALLTGHETAAPEPPKLPTTTHMVARVNLDIVRGDARLRGLSPEQLRAGDLVVGIDVTRSPF